MVSFTPSSLATWAIGRELSTTFLAACSLNSGVYRFAFPGTRFPFLFRRILLDPLSGNGGAPQEVSPPGLPHERLAAAEQEG